MIIIVYGKCIKLIGIVIPSSWVDGSFFFASFIVSSKIAVTKRFHLCDANHIRESVLLTFNANGFSLNASFEDVETVIVDSVNVAQLLSGIIKIELELLSTF